MRIEAVAVVVSVLSIVIVAARAPAAQSAPKRHGGSGAPAGYGAPESAAAAPAPPPSAPADDTGANAGTVAFCGDPVNLRSALHVAAADPATEVPSALAGYRLCGVRSRRSWMSRPSNRAFRRAGSRTRTAAWSSTSSRAPRRCYVDGFYIGAVEDFRHTGVTLPAGRLPGGPSGAGLRHVDDCRWRLLQARRQPTRFRGVLTALPRAAVPIDPAAPARDDVCDTRMLRGQPSAARVRAR